MSNEELALLLEYAYQRGISKKYFKSAIDAWWKVKGNKP